MKSAACLLVAVVCSGAFADDTELRDCKMWGRTANVHLSWQPTDTIKLPAVVTIPPGAPVAAGPMMSKMARIEVRPFTDTRKNPQRIGENLEGTHLGCIYPVTTTDDVAAWTTDRIRYVLGQLGFQVVGSGGDVAISGELRRFFVTEDSVYHGELGMRIDVTKVGAAVWSGVVSGNNTRFGRSYKIVNYQETLSDSIVDAVGHLVADSDFVRAVSP